MSEGSKFLNTTDAYLSVSRKSKLESTSRKGESISNVTSSKSFGIISQISSRQIRVTSSVDESNLSPNDESSSLRMFRKGSSSSRKNVVNEISSHGSDELSATTSSAKRSPVLGDKLFHAETLSRKSTPERHLSIILDLSNCLTSRSLRGVTVHGNRRAA